MVFENLLNPVFSPLLRLDPLWSILIISVFLTFLITLIYKLVTDQHKMKTLKQEIKDVQKQMKEHKNDPEKMLQIQKGAMEKNLEYMKHSFKPMIFTMIPILIIFGWLNAHLAFEPIKPGETFTVSALFEKEFSGEVTLTHEDLEFLSERTVTVEERTAQWGLKGEAGEYLLELSFPGKQFVKELTITEEQEYAKVVETYKDNSLKSIKIHNQKLIPFTIGKIRFNWIWTYILISIFSSLIIRKLMKVH